MYCVIATAKTKDPEALSPAQIIINKLQRMPDFKDWQFKAVHSTHELYNITDQPDVIAFSFDISTDMEDVFKSLPLNQAHSRLVLLTGTVNTKTKALIKMAQEYGLNNIVTGVGASPGDRPYTLLVALKQDIDTIFEVKHQEEQPIESKPVKAVVEPAAPEPAAMVKEPAVPEQVVIGKPLEPEPVATATEPPVVEPQQLPQETIEIEKPAPVAQPTLANTDHREEAVRVYREPEQPQNKNYNISTESLERPPAVQGTTIVQSQINREFVIRPRNVVQNSVIIPTSANKGGVGKTSAALNIAEGLAMAGIKTCLVDLDLGGANIAKFYKIFDRSGIEVFNSTPITSTLLADLIVELKPNLYLLPGVQDKSYPHFDQGKTEMLLVGLQTMFPVIIVDTPAEFWTQEYLEPAFRMSGLVVSMVDQSTFSEQETADYAPAYLWYDVQPENIRIVLNRYSPKGHNAKIIEKHFNLNFTGVPKNKLPRVAATIPNNWEEAILHGYKGKVLLEEHMNQWRPLLSEIAQLAGHEFRLNGDKPEKKGFLKGLFLRKRG